MFRATPTRIALATALCLLATVAIVAGAAAKGTPSNISVTCDSNVTRVTVTVQLLSGLNNATPASNKLVLACNSTDKIAPLSQPAAAYAWSAFVTGKTATFGCGGTTNRGTTVKCTNDAGTSADGVVTILAS